jgi:hypothetical protein
VVRGAEEPRARRWTAGTAAAAINGRGSVGRPFPGEEGRGALEAASVECSAHWREGEAARGGEGAWGSGGGRRGREVGGRLRLKVALTGGPHLSAARGRCEGVAGWFEVSGPVAGPRGKRKK